MTIIITETEPCLCGSATAYAACCGRYHGGTEYPPTAEALMRSRFSAYARRDVEYLLATWDSGKRPAVIDFSRETAQWHTLQIIACKKGGEKDSKGVVDFKAFYTQDDQEYFMHEISNFVKTAGRWLYVDGVIKAAGKVVVPVETGRNVPCPCGSGKKFKHCCGR